MLRRSLVVVLVATFAACSSDPPAPPLEVVPTAELEPVLHDFVALLPYPNALLRVAADPVAELAGEAPDARLRVAVVADQDCQECFRLERSGAGGFVVHGDR